MIVVAPQVEMPLVHHMKRGIAPSHPIILAVASPEGNLPISLKLGIRLQDVTPYPKYPKYDWSRKVLDTKLDGCAKRAKKARKLVKPSQLGRPPKALFLISCLALVARIAGPGPGLWAGHVQAKGKGCRTYCR
jgi:hypothetical protein